MAASQRETTMTASRSTMETARVTHAFEIAGYSQHKGLGIGRFVRSATFAGGGYEWCIRYYPDGATEESKDYIAVYLGLLTKNAVVKANSEFRLINLQAGGLSSTVMFRSITKFSSLDTSREGCWGINKFKKRSELEASPCLRHDRLVIECEVTVIKAPRVKATSFAFGAVVPPSDLSDNLGKLLEAQEEADVTFKVKGEAFPAHKIVLAMRSPVFKVELYGPMRDKRRHNITNEDMQPAVFKALLHFIYTDSMPSMDDLDGDDSGEMVKHLLVAADRYAMERMKMICEDILCKSLDVETVAATLALADQHHCSRPRDACVEFLVSLDRMHDVVASQGYLHLKRSCPAVIVDVFERATKSRKM